MKLSLDHAARMNLNALLGLQECRNMAETRAVWKLMDRFTLNEHEKAAIEFRQEFVHGNEVPLWNPRKSLAPVEYELSEAEIKQVEKALNNGGSRFLPGPMRSWLEPLLAQMPEPIESNGKGENAR